MIAVEVGPRVDNPPGSGIVRIQFVASQLVGVVMARYILELEPFASLPPSRSRTPSRRTCSATSLGICRTCLRHELRMLVVADFDRLVDQ